MWAFPDFGALGLGPRHVAVILCTLAHGVYGIGMGASMGKFYIGTLGERSVLFVCLGGASFRGLL